MYVCAHMYDIVNIVVPRFKAITYEKSDRVQGECVTVNSTLHV